MDKFRLPPGQDNIRVKPEFSQTKFFNTKVQVIREQHNIWDSNLDQKIIVCLEIYAASISHPCDMISLFLTLTVSLRDRPPLPMNQQIAQF
jgi:hypothetical protein